MKLILAADSFKGSLSSRQANAMLERAAKAVFSDCSFHKLTIADGGEGTLAAFLDNSPFQTYEKVTLTVSDPLGRPVSAFYLKNGTHAILEMAQASGLPLLKKEELNPLLTTSKGTGELIAHALKNGCRDIYLGIGGSATNDGGTGAMTALGFRFLDENGFPIDGIGENLVHIASIDTSYTLPSLKEATFTVMCDVTNPLTGPSGATYIYAPQKGANEAMLASLEEGMLNFQAVLQSYYENAYFCDSNSASKSPAGTASVLTLAQLPGLGAAGGLGASLYVLLNATMKSGIDVLLDLTGFDKLLENTDAVITGEGRTDSQSARGKVISGLLKRCKEKQVPLFVVSGSITPDADILYSMGISVMQAATPPGVPLETAMKNAEKYLYEAALKLFVDLA